MDSQNGDLANSVSIPGANIMHAKTTVISKTKAYMNLANPEWAHEDGHNAQVVLTQVPVIQQAKLPKLSTPPIFVLRKYKYFQSFRLLQNELQFLVTFYAIFSTLLLSSSLSESYLSATCNLRT